MSGFANYMASTTGGISRLWCSRCEAERLHKHGVCSCGTQHFAYPVRDAAAQRWTGRDMTIKRKRWNKG